MSLLWLYENNAGKRSTEKETGKMKARDGLTLMELVVAVSIIVILAAIMLPELVARGRAKSRQAYCVNNLGQLGKAFAMYTDRWDDWLPPFNEAYYDEPERRGYASILTQGGYLGRGGWGGNYPTSGVWRCLVVTDQYLYAGGGYGVVQGHLFGYADWGEDGGCVRLARFPTPSNITLIGDAALRDGYRSINYMHCPVCVYWPDSVYGDFSCGLSKRHDGGGNVCFMDQHVKWVSYEDALANRNDMFAHEWKESQSE